MRLEHGLNARRARSAAVLGSITVLLALGAGCGGSSEEETPAAAATTGAEAPPAPPAPEPAAEPAPPSPPAPEPPAPAANTAQPQMPTSAAVVIHTVKDYDAFKKVFDENQQVRKDGGALGDGVMRGVDNPKLVAVYLPTNDIAKLKEFTASKELKDKMKEAGVVGKPTIYLFNSAGGKMAPPDKASLFGAILELDTKDFAAFKTGLDAQQPARDTAGIVGYGLGQGVDKPNTAYLYLQSDDAAKLKTYLAAKDTKQAFKDAGVKNALKPTAVVQEATMTMYQQ
jgi:hypothetical protein